MLTESQRASLERLSTTNVADALDCYQLKGATWGVRPTYEACTKIVGQAVTLRLIPAGIDIPKHHLGQLAVKYAKAGDIIVVDNAGRLDVSCWGGVLSTAASCKGVSGAVIDGACRDLDDYVALHFPVYSRGSVTASARGRVVEDATNVTVQFCGVQVNPGDVVIADRSGVVFIPQTRLQDIIDKAEEFQRREEAMCAELTAGVDSMDVDANYNYNHMLKK